MKIAIIGTGSIGHRHIRNLLALGCEVGFFSHSGKILDFGPRARAFRTIEEILNWNPKGAVIANRSSLHVETAIPFAKKGINLFIEKPLSVSNLGIGELSELIKLKNLVVECGFNLRFHPALQFVSKLIEQGILGKIFNLQFSVGQYLPDWRPNVDYRISYSAQKLDGGVIFDLVHEIDLALWFGGEFSKINCMNAVSHELAIGSEAQAEISFSSKTGAIGHIHLDYLKPKYERTCEILGTRGLLKWNDLEGKVTLIQRGEPEQILFRNPADFERNTMFLNHMKHFCDRINGVQKLPGSSYEDSCKVLQAALAAHYSQDNCLTVNLERQNSWLLSV